MNRISFNLHIGKDKLNSSSKGFLSVLNLNELSNRLTLLESMNLFSKLKEKGFAQILDFLDSSKSLVVLEQVLLLSADANKEFITPSTIHNRSTLVLLNIKLS